MARASSERSSEMLGLVVVVVVGGCVVSRLGLMLAMIEISGKRWMEVGGWEETESREESSTLDDVELSRMGCPMESQPKVIGRII